LDNRDLAALGLNPIAIDIIQHSNDFFGVAKPDGQATFVNAAGRKIFGLGTDQDIGHLTMLDFIAQRDHELFAQEVIKPAYDNDSVHKAVHVRHFVTSEVFIMDFSFFLSRDDSGEPQSFMAFGKDLRTSYETQELLSSIQDSLNIGGWQLDVQTGQTIWSEKVYAIHKVPVGTPTGKIMAIDFYAPHERERISHYVEACIKHGEAYDDEFEFVDAEGNLRWIRTSGRPVYNDAGEISKVRGTFQDITDRKKLELENLETSIELELFKAVIENSPDFIGIADTNGVPIYVNPAGRKLVGIPPMGSLRHLTIAGCYPPDIRDEIITEIFAAIEQTGSFSGETRFNHLLTGEPIPVLDNHFVITDSRTEQPLGYATITKDISEEVALRAELEKEKTKLAQAAKMASLGELAAGVAHEINNPLTVISGSVQSLKRSNGDPEKLARIEERIDKSVSRITAIVNGLRKFSHSSEDLAWSTVDLHKVIEECISLVAPKARNTNHRITFSPQLETAICQCDEIQIEQVIINLLVNSIDANADLGDSWTNVYTCKNEEHLMITVQDSGSGIEEELLASIFDPFYTTKEVGAGTGLGLSISASIVTDHGGELGYQLMEGHTAFTVTLPFQQST
jgi:PAS domain S-box-containing protein